MNVSEDASSRFRELVSLRLGLVIPEGRLSDVDHELLRACRGPRTSTPEAYVQRLATLPDESPEWKRLAAHLTVGETYFFRDQAVLDALEAYVLPSLIAARRADGVLQLRLWSAGCATGEEPYSLAILVDRLLPDRPRWSVTILATDLNIDALHAAQRGIYRDWSFRGTPEWVRSRYFHRRDAENFEVDASVRQAVVFAPLNLNDDTYPSVVTNTVAIDVIVCRNVLMYFTPEAQRATVARLHDALITGGWLIVSPAEASAELLRPLVPVHYRGAILYRKEDAPLQETEQQRWSPVAAAREQSDVCVRPVDRAPAPATQNTFAVSPLATAHLDGPAVPVAEPQAAPPDTAGIVENARNLADHGQLDEAHRLCLNALASDQLHPAAHLLLAAICQERGDIGTAIQALRRAIYLDPDSAPAHFLLGTLLLRQGEQRRGKRSMETAVGLLTSRPRDEVVAGTDGLSAGPLLDMARAYLELGR